MSTLLLRLAAPMQAWGTDSRFDVRQTEREPSKSGVIGLLAAALGVRRDNDAMLANLCALQFGVRVEQEGSLLRDFHIARKNDGPSYLTHRYYLADAVFLVGLEGEDESFLQDLKEALEHPAFPLFLGRRSCPPTLPLVLGIRESGLRQALQDEPWQASEWRKKQQQKFGNMEIPHLRLITDAVPGDVGTAMRRDFPVSFNPEKRVFRFRGVTERGFVEAHCDQFENNETLHDAMEELR